MFLGSHQASPDHQSEGNRRDADVDRLLKSPGSRGASKVMPALMRLPQRSHRSWDLGSCREKGAGGAGGNMGRQRSVESEPTFIVLALCFMYQTNMWDSVQFDFLMLTPTRPVAKLSIASIRGNKKQTFVKEILVSIKQAGFYKLPNPKVIVNISPLRSSL